METSFEIIIIGSGLGGLSAGVALAKAGKKVAIVEQHYLAGGYATNFTRKTPSGEQIVFDASLHGIGGLNPGGNTYDMLKNLGVYEQLTFLRKQETATLLSESGSEIDIPDDFDAYQTLLKRKFPSETQNITTLFAFLKEFSDDMDIVYTQQQAPKYFASLQAQTLHEFLRQYTQNSELIEMFSFLWLYYGLPNTQLSALYYLLAWISYHIHGTFYIEGGAQALSDAFVHEFEAYGGTLLLREQVTALEMTPHWKIQTKKGVLLTSEQVIFNGAPHNLLAMIENPSQAVVAYQAELAQHEVGISLSQLYIGLDVAPQTLGLNKADYFTQAHDSQTNYELIQAGNYAQMDLAIVNYNLLDPTLNPTQGFVCLTLGDVSSNWPSDRRSEAYKAQKQAVTQLLLERLYHYFPEVCGHVTVSELGTPITMARYTSNPLGAVYGFAQSTQSSGFQRPYVKTPITKLYLASSWANPGGGYEGAIASGLSCAKQLLKDTELATPESEQKSLLPIPVFMAGMAASFKPVAPFYARYQFKFSETDQYGLVIEGKKARVVNGLLPDATTTICVSYPDWVAISSGTLSGEEALQTGRLKISGDMNLFFKIPESFSMSNEPTQPQPRKLVKGTRFLPLALVPWIVFWATNGAWAVELYLSVALVWSGVLLSVIKPREMKAPTSLEIGTLIIFGISSFIPMELRLLVMNSLFVMIWIVSLFSGRSMTSQYAQYEYPTAMVVTQLFQNINRDLTLMWAVIFSLQTLGLLLLPHPWQYSVYGLIAIGGVASSIYPKYKMGIK